MSSGIQPAPECLEAYNDLKTGKKLQYVIYGLSSDKKSIVVVKTAEKGKEATFEEFVGQLPEKDCRWAVYDFEYELPGEGKRSKITFIQWAPDEAPVKAKMVSASSKDALRRRLDGIHIEVQATDYSEITEEAILERANRR